jgi:hypothetical protein
MRGLGFIDLLAFSAAGSASLNSFGYSHPVYGHSTPDLIGLAGGSLRNPTRRDVFTASPHTVCRPGRT